MVEAVGIAPMRTPQAFILALCGELDMATVSPCAAEMMTLLTAAFVLPPPMVVLDLRQLRFCSAAGMDLVLDVTNQCAERGVSTCLWVSAEGIVRRMVDLLEIGERVRVVVHPTPMCTSRFPRSGPPHDSC